MSFLPKLALTVVASVLFTGNHPVHRQTEGKLYPVTENAKFGFANSKGQVVIEPKFDWASSFHDGLAMVEIRNKKGYIDESGRVVVEPQYIEAGDFSEGLAVVSKNYRWGYIDKKGQEVIPLQFIEARPFSNGFAAVYIQADDPKKDSQWGYIDRSGQVVIPPKFFKAYDFHDGVAKVIVGKFGDDNDQGFVNKKGIFVVKAQFKLTGEASEGLIPVEFGGRSEKLGERSYRHVSGKWGYVDSSGKVVIPARFDFAYEFSEGLANVTIGEKYGYIDKTGNVIIQPQFEYSSNAYRCAKFVEGRACFERNGKIGFIDSKGDIVIPPQFEFVSSFSEGIAQVNFGHLPKTTGSRFPISDNYGLIDRVGQVIFRPQNKSNVLPHQSEPVDAEGYKGWRKIRADKFSFYAPPDLQGGKRQGIDTQVYRYENSDLAVSFDIGFLANSEPRYPTRFEVTIDGLKAIIWHTLRNDSTLIRYFSGVYISLGANYNKIHFNMYVSYRDAKQKEVAEKMFKSLRFDFAN